MGTPSDTSTAELVIKHLQEPLPYVRDTYPNLPAALDGVIQRATAKNPADRYSSASALAEDYRRALQLETAMPEVSEEEIYNPYKGLRAFQEADCDDFFGREALTGQLLAQLAQPGEGNRFLAVVGPSGSGKSSVVKAGLLPALRKGALPGSDQWFMVEMHPGTHPLQELELALMSISADPVANLAELMNQDNNGLLKAAKSTLPGEEDDLLLVIDQFEELFILVEDEVERTCFLENLHHAVTDTQGPVRVVITLRADFYDRPLMHPAFGKLVEERTAVVLPLSPEELEQAIQRPAERVGAVLEKGLVTAITADVADQPGALPLLQYALTELFERREGRMLTNQAYQTIGGVLGALGRRAEEVYSDLEEGSKFAARQLFLRLVTLGEGAEDTRRRVLRSEIASIAFLPSPGDGRGDGGEGNINIVIDEFGKARLLFFDRDPVTRGPIVEVAHEALLGEWRRLREWLDESRADIRMQRVLGNAAQEWQETDREPGFLLRETRLDQFDAWAATTDMALTQVEGDYLDASLEERRARQAAEAERQEREAGMERRSRNFLRALVGVFAVAAIVAVGLTIFAFNQQGIAQDNALQADQNAATAQAEALARGTQQSVAETEAGMRATQQAIAETESEARAVAEEQAVEERDRAISAEEDALDQREQARIQSSIGLASQAIQESEGASPERAVPLVLEALEDYPYTWQAERALGQTVLNSRLKSVLNHDGEDWVNTAFWSADGTRILTGGNDGTVRVWDAQSGEQIMRIKESEPYVGSWSPDERFILTNGWLPEAAIEFGNLRDSVAEIEGLGEEELIWKDVLKIWDAESGQERVGLDMEGIEAETYNVVFQWYPWSPSGDRLAFNFSDGTVRIWDAETGELIQTMAGHQGGTGGALWSPNGELLSSSGYDDGTLVIWQADTGEALHIISVGLEEVAIAGWSPDGDQIAVRVWGGAKVYEAATGRERLNLSVPHSMIAYVKWSPDSRRILTTHVEDGTARVWDAQTGRELFRMNLTWPQGADWSPSGDLLAVGGAEGWVHLYEATDGREVAKLFSTIDTHRRVEFSPDGGRLMTHGFDNSVEIFDLSEAQIDISVNTCGYTIINSWSPDGEKVAFGLECPPEYPVKVWDLINDQELVTLSGNVALSGDADQSETVLAWSPSGDRILIAYEDQTARIWDTTSGELLFTFTGHESWVRAASWSPDGNQIASGEQNDKMIVWDSANGDEILTFSGYVIDIKCIKWSPNGERILTTSGAGEAIIWEAEMGEVLLDLYPDGYETTIMDAVWSQDGRRVFLLSGDGVVHIFDSDTGEKLSLFTTPEATISNISLSPTGERAIIGGHEGVATVWDTETGAELLNYEVGGIVLARYSPDGSRVMVTNTEGDTGMVQVFPAWHSAQALIDYAKECCVVRELTLEERELFGLPPRE